MARITGNDVDRSETSDPVSREGLTKVLMNYFQANRDRHPLGMAMLPWAVSKGSRGRRARRQCSALGLSHATRAGLRERRPAVRSPEMVAGRKSEMYSLCRNKNKSVSNRDVSGHCNADTDNHSTAPRTCRNSGAHEDNDKDASFASKVVFRVASILV